MTEKMRPPVLHGNAPTGAGSPWLAAVIAKPDTPTPPVPDEAGNPRAPIWEE